MGQGLDEWRSPSAPAPSPPLAHRLETGSTLAPIDVPEHGEYNRAHIPGASSVPRRQFEARMGRLVPFREAQVVV